MSALLLSTSREADVARAGEIVREGGLVAFATETVYGLGANALDARAVARIFEAKGRPAFDPLIVHLAETAAVLSLAAYPDPRWRALAERFWPGPLTLVLPRRPIVPDLVSAGLPTVGLRMPGHPGALALIRAAGTPIAAPSANPFGCVSPTTAAHVAAQLGDRVDAILDGGPCAIGLESTILSLAGPPTLLRPGAVLKADLEALVGPVADGTGPSSRPLAPGQLERHYATRTPLSLAPAPPRPGERVGLLALRPPADPSPWAAVEALSEDGDLRVAASRLFAALRRLDGLGLDRLVAEPVPERGLGVAIMNRLRRAAAR